MDDTAKPRSNGEPLPTRTAHRPRAGWEEAFRRMAAHGDNELLDAEVLTETKWENAEWDDVLGRKPRDAEEWVAAFSGKLSDVFGDHDDDMRYLEEERRGWEPE